MPTNDKSVQARETVERVGLFAKGQTSSEIARSKGHSTAAVQLGIKNFCMALHRMYTNPGRP
jgi:hypothetical protein